MQMSLHQSCCLLLLLLLLLRQLHVCHISYLDMVIDNSIMQGSDGLITRNIHVSTSFNQRLNNLLMAIVAGLVKWRPT